MPSAKRSKGGSSAIETVASNPLDAIFRPRSIAVIGASDQPGSVGSALMDNLASYGGRLFAVNAKHGTVKQRRAFRSVKDIGEKIDLVVIATPAVTVPGNVRDCVSAGVSAVVVISAGFRETGAAGAKLEREILREAAKGGMRIVGPNCLGIMSPHMRLNATFAGQSARTGSVAFLSQSGALCTAILDWSLRQNVGFSAFVSVGSMLDVGWGDLMDWLGEDPLTKSIVIYMESVGDARSFLSAAREVAFSKPVIVIKVGHTEAAARAAASHTGAMTGSDEVLDAAFRRAGVLRVSTIEELFDMAEVMSKQPLPRGPQLAIVTNAGGPGALATDMLVTSGAQPATLGKGTLASLDGILPDHWSHANPVDILGDADARRYSGSVEIVAEDAHADGTLAILTPQAMTDPTATARALAEVAAKSRKPFLASWMGGESVEEGRRILNAAGVPTYAYPDIAARAFALMWRRSENLRALYETPALIADHGDFHSRQKTVAEVIRRAAKAKQTLLSKTDCNTIFEAYGVPTNAALIASTEDEAVAHSARLGFPVVVKLHSAIITHKTEVGGVILDVRNEVSVREAWRGIRSRVKKNEFLGVTIERMIDRGEAVELIVGSTTDSQFGPVMLFGAGGQLVEVFKDRELGLPPLNATLARRMVERTRVAAALRGIRGRAPVDMTALEALLVRFSNLVIEHPRIKEVDINPLLASANGIVAVDVRILLHESGIPDKDLPRSAIRPYPAQHVSQWKLNDGTPVLVRPIRPEDEPLLSEFHHTLSPESVYYRYFHTIALDERIAHDRLARLCFVDFDRGAALVVEHTASSGARSIIGIGRLSKIHGTREAEFAILISDQWQGRGIGSELLKRLVKVGREEGLKRISADILPENSAMQAVARHIGFKVKRDADGECRAVIDL